MQFSKMHGLGNDFVVVDAITQNVYFTPEIIKRLSDRHRGIGFDQLLIVEPPYDPDLDFHYRIFNADGSEVSQCGNGARCFARFVRLKGLIDKKDISVSTQKGKMILTVKDDGQVRVNMGEPIWEPAKIPFSANKFEKNYILRTENHERFPERVNAGFMQILNRGHIKLRVYERGAGETQACGSGACAAAAVGIMQGLLDSKVQVDLPGGSLIIEWQGEGHPLYMTGDAVHVYDGNIQL